MDGQLQAVISELESAESRLHALWLSLSRRGWHTRPSASSWSPGECVAHLNLASEALLPVLRAGLRDASALGPRRPSAYRRDPFGWVIAKAIAPSSVLKMRSHPAFVPVTEQSAEAVIADFGRLQTSLIACVHEADGLPIDRVTVVSPFTECLQYNLYAALTLVPRHQHRHLLQAERAAFACAPLASALTA